MEISAIRAPIILVVGPNWAQGRRRVEKYEPLSRGRAPSRAHGCSHARALPSTRVLPRKKTEGIRNTYIGGRMSPRVPAWTTHGQRWAPPCTGSPQSRTGPHAHAHRKYILCQRRRQVPGSRPIQTSAMFLTAVYSVNFSLRYKLRYET